MFETVLPETVFGPFPKIRPPQIRRRHPAGPSPPPPLGDPPPSWDFQFKNWDPTPSWSLELPLPLPQAEEVDPDFRDRHLRKISVNFRLPAEKPKSAVDTQKTNKNRCLGIRCWDPNLSGGYQNCGLGIHRWENFQNRSGRNSEFFSKF